MYHINAAVKFIWIGVDIIDIEIKDRNPITDFFHKVHSKLEDLMFSIIKRLPDSMIPSFMIDWIDRYLTKRINQLKQENVRQAWRNMYLENALDEISNRQQQP